MIKGNPEETKSSMERMYQDRTLVTLPGILSGMFGVLFGITAIYHTIHLFQGKKSGIWTRLAILIEYTTASILICIPFNKPLLGLWIGGSIGILVNLIDFALEQSQIHPTKKLNKKSGMKSKIRN
jgi:cytochrome b subunit of formate dehydrogenase